MKQWIAVLAWALAAATVLYLGLCVYVYLSQDALVLPGASLGLPAVGRAGVAEALHVLPDGTRLRGGVAGPHQAALGSQVHPSVLYFGGNAEDATAILSRLAGAAGRKAVAYNYRGYAGSEGQPALAHFEADALHVFDAVAGDGAPVAVFGRSIGTGAAVKVAAERSVERLVLVSPYDSIAAVGNEVFPWLPLNLLLRDNIRPVETAARVQAPTLVILAGADTEIPPARSEALIAALGSGAEVVVVPGAGHNNLLDRPEAWDAIVAFLRLPEAR